jgi:hypothetical protein
MGVEERGVVLVLVLVLEEEEGTSRRAGRERRGRSHPTADAACNSGSLRYTVLAADLEQRG